MDVAPARWPEQSVIVYRNILENTLRLKARRTGQIQESGLLGR